MNVLRSRFEATITRPRGRIRLVWHGIRVHFRIAHNGDATNMIEIEDSLLERFHRLASETQRSEADIIKEALSCYLNNDAQYAKILRQRIDSADQCEFASAQEVSNFFTTLGD